MSDIYLTEIIDSVSGRSRSFYLQEGIPLSEWKDVYQAGFDFKDKTVGFKDDSEIYYPVSAVAKAPSLFHRKKLLVVFENANISGGKNLASIGSSSEDTLITEDHVKFAFSKLDKNRDGKVHKEEFIEVLSNLFDALFQTDSKLAYSYSCMTSSELAVSAANSCYDSIFEDARDDTYYLDSSDFGSWYMSGGNDLLKKLTISAFQLYQSNKSSQRNLKRQKSTPQLNVSKFYDDSAISSFFALGRRMISFGDENLSAVWDLFARERRRNHFISHELTKVVINTLLEESVSANLSKTEVHEIVGRFMQTVIEILDDQGSGSIHIGQLFSLLQLSSEEPDLRVFKSIFYWYRATQNKGMAFESVLFDHLKTVAKVIFYFNSRFGDVGSAEHLAHGVFLKLLLSVEITRKEARLLSLNEFVELFIHGLRLILSTLQIGDGYFEELLSKLVGYRVESIRADSTRVSPDDNANIGIMSPTGDSLEDDQVSSYMVGYNGTTMSVAEAREALGLYEYTGYDMVKYIMQLSDDRGKIDSVTFTRGVLKLIGEHYVLLSVLQRSVVDFILDRFALAFDTRQEGKFDMLEACIALLLFCEDDEYSRPEVILALLRPKVLKFSTVRAVVVILFQMCYSLNPSVQPTTFLTEAESDANTMCIAYYMRHVSSKADMLVNFTNTQFLDLITLVLTFLEEESVRRRDAGEDIVTYDEDGKSDIDDAKSNASDDNRNGMRSFSEDEASDGFIPYLNDQQYPPSSAVLELRAASSVLGLEHYSADDLIDKLGGESKAGRLDHHGWARWLGTVFQQGKVSEFDIDLAIFIGHKIFNAFQHDEQRTVRFSHIAIGLAFLCSKSPLEERLMVAFTLADEDSDGFLSYHDFCTLIKSVLTVISVCSKLVASKISALGVTLAELSKETALQGMRALGVEEGDEINLEMLSDLAEDYLKLAAFV